ncbi:uncharacterized protein EDB91DRAFT_1055208, partial [Suillus paluster]|uniref:uncharacterized protein n=1 Tax=Suillus paluster TaxID=48578 RepID=UPI001B87A33A
CLHVYLLGISNYRTVPLSILYSPLLISSLPKEIREKIGPQLGINIDEIECSMLNGDAEEDDGGANAFINENAAPGTVGSSNDHDENENINVDVDYNKDDTDFELNTGDPGDIDGDDSVVVEKGKPESDLYTLGRFWNFVDSLASACNAAKEQAMEDKGPAYEKAYSDILVQYLQQDLSDFPGNTKVPTLLSTNRPQWQLTIQNKLLWAHA